MEKDNIPIVRLRGVTKEFFDATGGVVLKELDLDIYEGEFLTLLGPSGCGKTTTLRMIGGFDTPTQGTVYIGDQDVTDLPPYKRDVNTVFQSYALFPHMNVFDNVAFGLVEKKIPKAEIKARVEKMLDLVQLKNFGKRKVAQMSGGQKQRVAIARALVNNPKLLLLDEPLAALDYKLRKQMQIELKHLQKKLGITFIYVTHDQEEALTMSDRIAVMNNGLIEQIDVPSEIYEHPKTKFVADFIGESNIIEASVTGIEGDLVELTAENGVVHAKGEGFVKDEMVYISIRPEHTKYSTEPIEHFRLRGVVKEHIYVGSLIKTTIMLPDGQILKINHHPDSDMIPVGQAVNIYWPMDKAVVMHTAEDTLIDWIEGALLHREEIEAAVEGESCPQK
ncbi:MAG: ABC transporter ATP-binding protein [Lachnospiraceae bacterium]|nr:ABC transporter ATP-binding protein [Lachnospiraceae bacterium]MBQ5375437.1 ABC transporter ATP-binding protein [Lachnospiraceae bacterium]